ncbi:MAG: hypothetical protein [Circular genetic element sp.]|nr:MAG: hypothetical protein [Circular genetic element sp.]
MARAKQWSDYDIGDLREKTTEEIQAAVRKAAKAANQRLLRLERAGLTDAYSYKAAMSELVNRKRYTEHSGKLKRAAAIREYKLLREFLSMKGSTVAGLKSTDLKRYNTAVERGFEGTFGEFYEAVARLFTKQMEELFDSHTLYQAIREGNVDLIDKIVKEDKKRRAKIKTADKLETDNEKMAANIGDYR